MKLPIAALRWRKAYRIVSSRFPPVPLFERVAAPADLEAVFELEALTNDRLREEAGELALVAPADRVSGPGTSPIMAAFTHPNPSGSRFSDGSFGVFYCAHELPTAVAETCYHRERFLARTHEPPIEVDMRVYVSAVRGRIDDARGLARSHPIYRKTDYAASQRLGGARRAAGSFGIVYRSVRRAEGECAAVFRPPCLVPCLQGPHLTYVWDGSKIAHVYEKRGVDAALAPLSR